MRCEGRGVKGGEISMQNKRSSEREKERVGKSKGIDSERGVTHTQSALCVYAAAIWIDIRYRYLVHNRGISISVRGVFY